MTDEDWYEWQLMEGYDFQGEESLQCWKVAADKIGLTPWDLAIFESVWYGYAQVDSLPVFKKYCFGKFNAEFPDRANQAVQRAFDKDWIQFLTQDFVAKRVRNWQRKGIYRYAD